MIPSYDHYKSFRCLCSASTIAADRSKFDPCSVACVFLGYLNAKKGYKFSNLKSDNVFIYWDINFHEKHFLYYSIDKCDYFPIQNYFPTITTLNTDDHVFDFSLVNNTSASFEDSESSSPYPHSHSNNDFYAS